MTRRPAEVAAKFAPAFLAAVGLVAYAFRLHLRPLEILRTTAGLIVLWGPLAALVYLALRREVPQRVSRLTFSLIASYALTTLLYFACCVVWTHWLFYPCLVIIAAGAFLLATRGGPHSAWRRRPPIRLDWPLTLLIITTLILFVRYQIPYRADPTNGGFRTVVCLEQTYFIGHSYELARHTPPLQQVCQAGIPERAYHLLPYLAAMLIARFSGQSDFMHAHLVYHYAFLTVLTCLAFFSIAERLAKSRAAGYLAVCFFVIFAIPFPPIGPSCIGYHYFNYFPLASTLLEPTVVTSPQMYSGMAVTFGILLGIVLICRQLNPDDSRAKASGPFGILVCLCALMVASTSRFRVQVFIPMAPAFLLCLPLLWWRGRSRAAVTLAAVLTVVASALLYAETRWPGYVHGTASVHLHFAPSEPCFLTPWPFSQSLSDGLHWFLSPRGYALVWPSVATLGFTLFAGIGLPLLAASAWCVVRRRAWRDWGPFTVLTLLLVFGSLFGSQVVQSGYDSYSIGGQMLLHIGWYLLPFLGLAVWDVAGLAIRLFRPHPRLVPSLFVCLVAAAVVVQLGRGPSTLERAVEKLSISIPHNDWLSLQFLHDHTPASAVIVSDHHLELNAAFYPGIAGRAASFAYLHEGLDILSRAADRASPPPPSRLDLIHELWSTPYVARFAELMATLHATHLVEFSGHPLKLGTRRFLQPVWESSGGHVRVRVLRFAPDRLPRPTTRPGPATAATTPSPHGSGS